jgi:hypothetical protein
MTRDWGVCYHKIDGLPPESGPLTAWFSPALEDLLWDDFLRGTTFGQFQQSSMWADYKAGEGWKHHRVILTEGDEIVGGFQMLWRKSRLGRIGYVSKGPVTASESVEMLRLLEVLLKSAVVELGLVALIIQSPDASKADDGLSPDSDFLPSNPMGVIEATYLVDVRAEKEALHRNMSPSLRRNIRKARRQPMNVREGTEADLPKFFELMEATCRRQLTKPNPASLNAVRRLWHAFAPSNSVRLTFADCPGDTPATKLSLIFGERMTVWKKGWDGSHGDWHPNELLESDALEWAHDHGCRICDFCSFNRAATVQLSNGRPPSEICLTSRDEYHFRFGGLPKLLPRARLHVPNPILRWGYHNAMRVAKVIKSNRYLHPTRRGDEG